MRLSKQVSWRRRDERGVILLMATAALVAIIPLVGLSVDVGYLYACKARIQAAVDGASLAAARALVLGATTSAQADTAKQNAVNWFYANFPNNNWGTRNITMSTATVDVRDETTDPSDPTLRNVRRVEVRAEVDAPSYFMRWFGSRFNYTHLISTGTANRRDVVVMMVLDRSASMNPSSTNGNHDSCVDLKKAAKTFTGQFAAGRDRIGMVSFSDGVGPVYIPSQNFRTSLGFTDGTSSGTGAIDQISCGGGTGTAEAISIAQKEIDRINLPGALNILLLETDGLPNSLAFDFWDSTRTSPNNSALANLGSSTGCTDARSTPRPRGWNSGSAWGWDTVTNRKNWSKPGPFYAAITGEVTPTAWVPSGMIGTIYSTDPSRGSTFGALMSPWHNLQSMGLSASTTSTYSYSGAASAITNQNATGCKFSGTGNAYQDLSDFNRLPRTDLFGNDVKPATDPYYSTVTMVDNNNSVTASSTAPYLQFSCSGQGCSSSWTNFRRAVANATDSAASRARSGLPGSNNIASTIYVIGLGGNATALDTPDYSLMQRWANDPRADQFNGTTPLYNAYTMPGSFSSQPQGRLVFSSSYSDLQQAFLEISSQILRLSQ